jgi:CubicO group peptidase (beta-lactamase class C family)
MADGASRTSVVAAVVISGTRCEQPCHCDTAVAVLRSGVVSDVVVFGRRCHAGPALDEGMVFEAASLTKPLFARFVICLSLDGLLDLDASFMSGEFIESSADARLGQLTPVMVLTHTTGLANWRRPGQRLELVSPPGTPGYSGEAFKLLLDALRSRLGNGIEVMLERLLGGLGMANSSFLWRSDYEGRSRLVTAPMAR